MIFSRYECVSCWTWWFC